MFIVFKLLTTLRDDEIERENSITQVKEKYQISPHDSLSVPKIIQNLLYAISGKGEKSFTTGMQGQCF